MATSTLIEIEKNGLRLKAVKIAPRPVNYLRGPNERSCFEVYVDDVLRGHIIYPHGAGRTWQMYALGTTDRFKYDFDVDRPTRLKTNPGECRQDKVTPEGLLACCSDWFSKGLMPSQVEIAQHLDKLKEAAAAKKIEDKAQSIRWAEEAVELHRTNYAACKDRLTALESIRSRLAASLSNSETNELMTVIAETQAVFAKADESLKSAQSRLAQKKDKR